METNRICPSCQKTLPPNVPLGLCPECLIKSGFNTGTAPGNPGKDPGFVPPPVEEIRKLFPQLEIIELIGKGGMGAVYKARQLTLDRFVALKILPPGAADDAGFAERFNREARALARLNHPHIVAVHDFGQAGGQPYLVMEFVDGPNLRQVEQAGRLTPEQALEIVPQICEALQFAHNEGVVHRDIKPENILLDKKGRVKITDFGIAKILGVPSSKVSLTGAKDLLGTPHYMAPEQVEKPQTVDHRADIYSLGVVFYELLTGELPLGKFAAPSKKVHVDVRLDEVVLHTLEKEPDRRYQHASEVKTDVETIAATPAPAVSRVAAEERTAWRGLAQAWVILLVVMSAAVILGWFASDKSFSLPACLGAVFAVATVVTLFGAWLLNAVRGSGAGTPVRAPGPAVSPEQGERIRREVRGPAIGLVVTGILNWLAIPLIVLVISAVVGRPNVPGPYLVLVPLAALILSSVMIVAGLKMKRLEAFGLAVTGSILAILITPGNVIGLPIGIWALVVLSHCGVRAAFGKDQPLPLSRPDSPQTNRGGSAWKVAVVIAALVMIVLAIPVGAFFLAIAIPSFNKARERARAIAAAQNSAPPMTALLANFGPVREVTLNDIDELRGAEALDLEGGKLLDLPKDLETRPEPERQQWLKNKSAGLLLDKVDGRWGLMTIAGNELKLAPLLNNSWEASSESSLSNALAGLPGGVKADPQRLHRVYADDRWQTVREKDLPVKPPPALDFKQRGDWRVYVLAPNAQPPLTFAFQTASGTSGLLQITEFTEKPNSARLRYKLATPAVGSGGNNAATLTQAGWQLWQGGRPADAIPKFESAVRLDPKNTGAWNGLGWASFNSGKSAEAEKAFQTVIELEPGHPGALNGLGQIYLTQKKYAEAEAHLLKASAKAPAAWYGLARLYLIQGKFEQAEKWAQNIVDSGQADEGARRMLQAAKDKKVSEGLRLMIEHQ